MRRPAAAHHWAGNEEVRNRRRLFPAGAIAIGYFLSLAPETLRSVADDMGRHQFVMQAGWPLAPKGGIFGRATSSTGGRAAMPRVKQTHLCAGLFVAAVGLAVFFSSPANADRANKKQGSYHSQRVASNASARRVKVQQPNAVYWGCCTKMGADPDPFIRSQILRDASGFFGGIN